MTHFVFDITRDIRLGGNSVVARVYDDVRGGKQPTGKQCRDYHSSGCSYTRTTGISVWLEYIPFSSYIKSLKTHTDIENSTITINAAFSEAVKNAVFTAEVLYKNSQIASKSVKASSSNISVQIAIPLNELHLWDVGKGELYDLILSYGAGESLDVVYSYFGMRSIAIDKEKNLINGRPVFQRLVLDQGFYPDGIWTAPVKESLKNDILLSMEAGFNGARLHQKIFEPLFHRYADKLGYITWGEHGNWGMDYSPESYQNFMCEWIEALERDFSHPSIIGWCPHNETEMGMTQAMVARHSETLIE